MAEAVADACEQPNTFNFMYEDSDPIDVKIEKIAKRIYRAEGVDFLPAAQQKIEQFTRDGLTGLSICMAKTHLSLSADPALANAPTGFRIPVRDIRPYTGAGFLTAAVRRHHADAGPGQDPGRLQRGHRRGWEDGRTLLAITADDPYLSASVAQLLDDLAARTPAPGGGAAAALTCAMAAALVEMATSFASAQGLEAVRERAHVIRGQASGLAYADGRAYGVVLEALRMEKGDRADGAAWTRRCPARSPCRCEVLELASEVATLAADVAETGNRNLEGDALAGVAAGRGGGALGGHAGADEREHAVAPRRGRGAPGADAPGTGQGHASARARRHGVRARLG